MGIEKPPVTHTEYKPGTTVCIHLIHPNPDGKIPTTLVNDGLVKVPGGFASIACAPQQAKLPYSCSQETSAVNCPLCLKTDAYKRIAAEQSLSVSNDADGAALLHALTEGVAAGDANLDKAREAVKAQMAAEAAK